jgi:hypothetical protein
MKPICELLAVISVVIFSGCSQLSFDQLQATDFSLMQKFSNDDYESSALHLQNVNASIQPEYIDTIPPIITLIGFDTVRIPYGDPENLLQRLKTQYRVVDNSDPDPVVTTQPDISVLFMDTCEMRYIATDNSGNQSSKTRIVIILPEEVVDSVPPVINVAIKDIQIYTGEHFDPLKNVAAYDNVDGSITDRIVVSGKVNTSVAGKYLLTYSVKDRAGNVCTIDRTITVIELVLPDTGFPVITLIGDKTMYMYENQAYKEPGYTAFDAVDGDITANVVVYGSVKSQPGTYWITYTVADKALNIVTSTRIVIRKAGSLPDTVKLSVRVPGNL